MKSGSANSLPKRLTNKKPPLRVKYTPLSFYYEDGLLADNVIQHSARQRADIFDQQLWVKMWVTNSGTGRNYLESNRLVLSMEERR